MIKAINIKKYLTQMKIQQKQEIGTSAIIMNIGTNMKRWLMIIKVDGKLVDECGG